MEKITLRTIAKAQGNKYYYTGKPCKRNHIDNRYVSDGSCVSCVLERLSGWNEKNPNVAKERVLKWQKDFPEKVNSKNRNWKHINKHKVCEQSSRRRARVKDRFPQWANIEKIQAYYSVCKFFNDVNGYIKYHVDHDIPLFGKNVSGLHVENNLRVILAKDNILKGNKYAT